MNISNLNKAFLSCFVSMETLKRSLICMSFYTGTVLFSLFKSFIVKMVRNRRLAIWFPAGIPRVRRQYTRLEGRTEDFADRGDLELWYTVATLGRDSAHQDCGRRTFLGSFGCMLLRGNFLDWSSLRCTEMQSRAFWTLKFGFHTEHVMLKYWINHKRGVGAPWAHP